MAVTLMFDTASTLSYGLWECPLCGAKFYGGGPACCWETCSRPDRKSYDGIIYHFTINEVGKAKEIAAQHGEEAFVPLGPVSMRLLKDQGFGELLKIV